MKNNCSCGFCDDSEYVDDYDDIIEQLKETRNSIDRMIRTLEQRKIKDNVISRILNTEYEDEDKTEIDEKSIEELLDALGYTYSNYRIPNKYKAYYPYYFKF